MTKAQHFDKGTSEQNGNFGGGANVSSTPTVAAILVEAPLTSHFSK